MAERKEMTGALFPNNKGDNPKRPDYRGEILINGETYKLSGWLRDLKKGKNAGDKYLSLKAEPFGERSERPASTHDEDLPF